MKISYLLIAAILSLSACAAYQESTPQERICASESNLNHDNTFNYYEYCISNFNARNDVLAKLIKKESSHNLCSYSRLSVNPLVDNEIKSRKVSCDKIFAEAFKVRMATSSVDELCSAWYDGNSTQYVRDVLNREVKKRGVDCVAVVQVQRQQILQQQQIIQQQRLQEQIYLQNTRPVTTECTNQWNGVSCTTR